MSRRITVISAHWMISALALMLAVAASAARANEAEGTAQRSRAAEPIVVTGTRLPLAPLASAEPVITVLARQVDDFAYSHFADTLNDLPGFRGSLTPEGAQNEFGQGVNFLNTFGLGSNRTLVLVDGQRFVSSNGPTVFSGATPGTQVDLNAIP